MHAALGPRPARSSLQAQSDVRRLGLCTAIAFTFITIILTSNPVCKLMGFVVKRESCRACCPTLALGEFKKPEKGECRMVGRQGRTRAGVAGKKQ